MFAIIRAASAAEAPADAPAPAFDVMEFRVLGNSVLPARDVERAVYSFLGSQRTLKDVEAARAALETVYHERGFGTVFVDVPEQDVDEGVVRLRIVEGRFGSVTVAGARYFSGRRIRSTLPSATPGRVPFLPALQAELKTVNTQNADRTVIPVMKAGAEPATVDMLLNVDEHFPLHIGVELNNAHTADTTPERLLLDAHYTNSFGRLDDASLQYQLSPQNRSQVSVFAANYAARLGTGGEQLAAYYIRSRSAVATVGTLDVLGNGKIIGARLITPLTTDGALQGSLSLGLDWKDFAQQIELANAAQTSTPVKYTNATVALDLSTRREHFDGAFELMPSFGPRGAVNQTAEFAAKCYQCRPNYFYVKGFGRASLHDSAGWSITARVAGQLAGEPLVANEQYAIGGVQTVRGYLEADSLGDSGFAGTLQLASPPLGKAERVQLSPYGFFDLGRVTVLQPLPGQPLSVELRSFGVGVDFSLWEHVSGYAAWAEPLVGTAHTERGVPLILFSIRGSL